MRAPGQASRRRLQNAVELLPYGRDLLLAGAGARLGIAYRGVFETADAARNDLPDRATGHYDRVNELRRENEDLDALGQRFIDTDYPLLFWLSRSFRPGLRVLELGGSLGHLFYALETRAPFPDDAEWAIAELPHAVELGQEIAERKGEHRLSFMDSDVIGDAKPCDLFVSAGTLQYMERRLPDILSGLGALPAEVLVHNTPMHASREWWTRQNLGVVEVPYRIYSRTQLVQDMADLGYHPTASWGHERSVPIPFHLDLEVDGYLGFRFEQQATTTGDAGSRSGAAA